MEKSKKDISGIPHTHSKGESKKQVLIYYFSPDHIENKEWDCNFDDIPLQTLLDEFEYSMFTVEEFLDAFNREQISDLGLVRYVHDYEVPEELRKESMVVVLNHEIGEVDIIHNFSNNEDSAMIEDNLLDKGYNLQNISWMHGKEIKINLL